MYDELIKRLRGVKDSWQTEEENLMLEAADAVEELSRENKELSFRAAQLEAMNDALIGETGAADALMVASKPRWISVEEALPEENVPCIVHNKDYGPMVGWRVDGERFRIPGSRFPDHPAYWLPLPKGPEEE